MQLMPYLYPPSFPNIVSRPSTIRVYVLIKCIVCLLYITFNQSARGLCFCVDFVCSFLSSYRNLWFRAFYFILQMLFLSFCKFNMANYVSDFSVNLNHIESISTLFKMLLFPLQIQTLFLVIKVLQMLHHFLHL